MKPVDMVVLCGGPGKRLGPLTTHIPKPLLSVGGSPFLLRLLLQWKKEGISRFILATHYLHHHFHAFVEQYAPLLGEVEVVSEAEPFGTGGGLKYAASFVKTPVFFAANGDSYVSQSLSQILEIHQKNAHNFTLVAVPAKNVLGGAIQKGRVIFEKNSRLTGFSTEESLSDGWVNSGLYALNLAEIEKWPGGKYDLEKIDRVDAWQDLGQF